jgi:hypothetical protein
LTKPARASHLGKLEPFRKLAAHLTRMSEERRLLTPTDIVAEALTSVVGMLEDSIDEASDLDSVMDVDTAAEILKLGPSMVRVLCKKGLAAGGLDAQKLGGEWRISRASVEARLGKVL